MATHETTASDALDADLRDLCMEGHWIPAQEGDAAEATFDVDPHPRIRPHIWKWSAIHGQLMKAGDERGLGGLADRRTLRLINPAVKDERLRRNRSTTHTIQMSIQLLKKGETASSHRHNFGALRFIVEGSGAYTVVEGEKFIMEPGDLVLNPPGSWHGHFNDAGPIIWLDGLDYPLVHALQCTTWEAFPGEFQNIKPDSESTGLRLGAVRPVWDEGQKLFGPLCYKWADTYATLAAMKDSEGSAFDGIALEYVNPLDGGHTFPTMSCWIQMLREGEETRAHRHNHSSIYHAFRGAGTTVIDGREYDWEQGDVFVVPLWATHSHRNRSKDEEAILFSMNDRPMMEALKLWREEAR